MIVIWHVVDPFWTGVVQIALRTRTPSKANLPVPPNLGNIYSHAWMKGDQV